MLEVPAAARALGRSVRVAVLKGRQNYLCRKQLQSFGPMLLRDPRDEEAFEALQPWLAETATGDQAELSIEPSEALWSELAVGSDRCAGRRCPFFSTCFAEAARSRAGEAELVIANHALYFADLAAGGGVLPDHDAVVFDEAHRLEESAASWLGARVSRYVLRRLSTDVERACREGAIALPAKALDRIERAGDRLWKAVSPASGRRRLREPPAEPIALLAAALRSLAEELHGHGEELDLLARRTLVVVGEAEACLEADPLQRVVWAEPDTIRLGARRRVERASGSASGTTGMTSDPRLLRRSRPGTTPGSCAVGLGVDHARELVVGSPCDFREQALLYVPRTFPDPRTDGFTRRAADEVAALLRRSPRGARSS